MRNLFSKSLLLTTSVLSFGAAAPALAQAGADDDSGTIVVTARRVEERLQDVPISITVLSQQQLTNRNIVSAGDLGTYTPSLSSNGRFGSENTSFAIRGFTQDGATAPSVGVYFADVTALRAVGGTTVGNGAGVGAYFDLQNVQVLKGPQGTLFGRNTTGGAVLLVPQKPTSKFEGYVEGSVGNYDMRRIQAVVNVPVGDSFRFRVGVDRQTRDGYLINHSGIGPKDFGDTDYWALRVSAVADLTANLENYTVLSYSRSDTNGFMPRVVACDTTPVGFVQSALAPLACNQIARQNARGDGFYDVENGAVGPRQLIQQWQAINTTTWRASDSLTVKNIISYGEFREAFRSPVFGENLVLTAGANAGQSFPFTVSNPYPGRNSAAQSTFTEEFQLQGRTADDRLMWQAGLYTELSEPLDFSGSFSPTATLCADTNVFNCRVAVPGLSGIASRSSTNHFQNYGAYAQGTYKLTDQFSVTAGVRYTYDRTRTVGRQLSLSAIPVTTSPPRGTCTNVIAFGTQAQGNVNKTEDQCQVSFVQVSQKPTWLIDVDYKPTDDILLYAKYARGYRQGGVFTFAPGLETFQPEKVESYEIGAKTSWRGAFRGTLNVAAFYNDFSNQQLSLGANSNLLGSPAVGTPGQPGFIPAGQNPSSAPNSFIANAGKSRIAGVEVDASITPFEGLTIDGAYAYLDTKLKSLSFPEPSALFRSYTASSARVGSPLTLTPKNKYTVTATYTLPLDESIGRISFGATFTHSDSQYSAYGNTPFIAETGGRDLGRLPAQNLLNLNLNWHSIASKPVDLALFVTNVTKKEFPVHAFGAYGSFGYDSIATNQPRMYGVRLKYRFGS